MGSGFHFEEGADLVTINGRDIPVFLAVLAAALGLGRAAVLVVRAVTLSAEGRLAEHTGLLFPALLVENIPTLLLLLAYGACRLGKRWKTIGQLKKTRIQDL